MRRYLIQILMLCGLLILSLGVRADITLSGSMAIGDDSGALVPTQLVTASSGTYQPVNPIYFSLTQAGTLSTVTLNALQGGQYGVNLVIWDNTGAVVFSQSSSAAKPGVFTVNKSLAIGTYRMAVWGQCVNSIFNIFGLLGGGCSDSSLLSKLFYSWNDIQFSGITLGGVSSDIQHFIARKHIGDSTEIGSTRWYPDAPSSNTATYSLSFTQPTRISQLTLYRFRDWQITNASRIAIWSNSTNSVLWEHVFTAADDDSTALLLSPNLSVDAGDYSVVVSTDVGFWFDADDMSWDELTVFTSTSTQTYDCGSVFPYPVQGRTATDSIAFGGGVNTSSAGLIYGTSSGKIGMPKISGINTLGNYPGNCDGLVCTYAGLGGTMPLTTSKFPTTGTKNMAEYYWSPSYQSTLTVADGTSFGTIEIGNNTTFNIRQSDITIRNLILDSGTSTIVTLDAGEYWIDNLTISNGAQLKTNGYVVLHVKNLTMASSSYINSPTTSSTPTASQGGDTSQLMLILYGPMQMGNNAIFSGMIYSTDENTANPDINMASPSYIFGRVSAHHIVMTWGSTIYGADSWCTTGNYEINHYQIDYPAQQISCEPAVITIKACSNSDMSSCTVNTNVEKTVTMSAPSSGWTNTSVTLTKGIGTATLNHYASGSVKLGMVEQPYSCFSNSVKDDTCTMAFVGSQFSFNIPTFYSGGNSGNVTLKAIQSQSTATSAVCVPLLTGTKSISFSNTYVAPTSGTMNPTVNGTAISSNTPVSLSFDSTGLATFSLGYNDAGVLNVTAATSVTDKTAGTLTVSGSDTVAVIPPYVHLSASDAPACTGSNDAEYAACKAYKKTGESFTITGQTGYYSGGSLIKTPNFATDQMQTQPTVIHSLLAPSTGKLPNLSTTPTMAFSAGTGSTALSEADVGVYAYGVSAFVPYPGYQDESPQKTVSAVVSDAVGRIIPSSLQTNLNDAGTLTTQTCSNRSVRQTMGYLEQSLRYDSQPSLQVWALGADGSTVLTNYRGAFAKITQAFPDGTGAGSFLMNVHSATDTSNLASVTWAAGNWGENDTNIHWYTFSSNDAIVFKKQATTRQTHFEPAFSLTSLIDSDGVIGTIATNLQNFKPTTPASSAFYVYDGRLVSENGNADENSSLTLPLTMQYWDGSRYVLNSEDQCSQLSTAYFLMNHQTSWLNIALQTDGSVRTATTTATLSPADVVDGQGALVFTAPGAPGWVDISASSLLPVWMQDPTLSSGFVPVRASFGFFRGNDRVIYRREVFGN